jgi:predicted lipoprotein with Yx(FWY)xxD motif
MENPMPRKHSLWQPALAVSGLALLAACVGRPVEQNSYAAPDSNYAAPEAQAPVVPAYTPAPVYTPASTTVAAGTVLTTSNGMTVYVFDRDTPGRSTCYDQCAQYWMPVYAPAGAVSTNGLTLIQRADGQMQWATSNGQPLYTYVNDHGPGDASGNNIDGTWHVVAAYSGSSTYPTSYPTTNNGYPYSSMRTVTADGAAVTVQPDSNSAIVTVVNAGAQVRVLDVNGQWSHVQANGQDGFIRTGALR